MFIRQFCRRVMTVSMVALLFPLAAGAKEILQILPTRIVLDGERSADLTLINRGDVPGNYRILLRNIRTDDDGQFHEAKEAQADEKFADRFIRYSPRSITVEPESNQKVRLVVRAPRDLEAGEYRTHMVFQSLPTQVPDSLGNQDRLQVSVEPIVEISIPVIVRVGGLEASAELAGIQLLEDNVLKLQIKRQGTRSLYGSVEVFVDSGLANGVQAGFVKGVAVYVPNKVRNLLLPLKLPATYNPRQDSLLVRFKEDPAYGGEQTAERRYTP